MEDINGKRKLRVNKITSKVLGICYHSHLNRIGTEVNREEDCISIKESLDSGDYHCASEFTNVVFVPNREHSYECIFFVTSSGCQNNDPEESKYLLIKTCIKIYINCLNGEGGIGRLSTLKTYRDLVFIKIGQNIFFGT